ncbi:uncharacterized protein METZ01_LOCUS434752 [marine metagenome]|uniref:Uncharacterized protein n=1 Tax=marine metagenome TaxID=408172 RepID=A0A382YHA9_9ZZZZ
MTIAEPSVVGEVQQKIHFRRGRAAGEMRHDVLKTNDDRHLRAAHIKDHRPFAARKIAHRSKFF